VNAATSAREARTGKPVSVAEAKKKRTAKHAKDEAKGEVEERPARRRKSA
jgi:hypothetical protein